MSKKASTYEHPPLYGVVLNETANDARQRRSLNDSTKVTFFLGGARIRVERRGKSLVVTSPDGALAIRPTVTNSVEIDIL